MSSFFKFKLTDGLYEHDFNLIKNTLNSYIIFGNSENNNDSKNNNIEQTKSFHEYKEFDDDVKSLKEYDVKSLKENDTESISENKTTSSFHGDNFNEFSDINKNGIFIDLIIKNHKYIFISTSFYLLFKIYSTNKTGSPSST